MSLPWLCYVPGDLTPELRSVVRRRSSTLPVSIVSSSSALVSRCAGGFGLATIKRKQQKDDE